MSKSMVHNRMREGFMREGFTRRHSNPTKPLLTKLNEKVRLEFCISMIDPDKSNINGKPTFVDIPRFVVKTNEWFDGKIGVFPNVCTQAARRSIKNRVAGTRETKPILDNARPHTKMEDPEFLEAAKKDSFDIRLCFQPPNSPDINVLDLGFFASIQALQHKEPPNSIDQLVAAVQNSFDKYEPEFLNDVFLSLQQTMVEVLKVLGKNNYKSPHMSKGKLKRIDQLPICLSF
ncbi:hypothetical protein LIER_40194 [Lithospermum erythrorhizon]|uniref:Transposase n=1 Tax=Lithospermum erythrorhizon TaxID=34254 RepID=A0AAV3QTB7_LITER